MSIVPELDIGKMVTFISRTGRFDQGPKEQGMNEDENIPNQKLLEDRR